MNAQAKLEDFKEVDLSSETTVDTTFADDFLKTISRIARAQLKTQQSISMTADDVRQHLERQEELIADIKQQREALRTKNEKTIRFLLEVSDLITNLYKTTRDSRDGALAPVAETMLRALDKQMEKINLTRIPAMGEVPDGLYHFVLDTRSGADSNQRDRIVDVVREGYLLEGVVIRKADVIVGK
jgi:molecular chaperone GrpE (heat shock protein)